MFGVGQAYGIKYFYLWKLNFLSRNGACTQHKRMFSQFYDLFFLLHIDHGCGNSLFN